MQSRYEIRSAIDSIVLRKYFVTLLYHNRDRWDMKLIYAFRNWLAGWIFGSSFVEHRERNTYRLLDEAIASGMDSIREQLKAFQAIDHSFNDYGHIVIVQQVGNQDFVEIIKIDPQITLEEWRAEIGYIESCFGIKPRAFDSNIPKSAWMQGR